MRQMVLIAGATCGLPRAQCPSTRWESGLSKVSAFIVHLLAFATGQQSALEPCYRSVWAPGCLLDPLFCPPPYASIRLRSSQGRGGYGPAPSACVGCVGCVASPYSCLAVTQAQYPYLMAARGLVLQTVASILNARGQLWESSYC